MVDYSKWKDIEISDDEDDTHPNIDTPSLFRWRHQARVERMEELEKEKEKLQKEKSDHLKSLKEIKAKVEKGEGDQNTLQMKLSELEKKSEDLTLQEQTIKSQEKKTPWNVDTISKPVFSKTIINTKAIRPGDEHLTEEEREQKMKDFVKTNEKLLKQYGMLQKFDDSKRFLMENNHLACENTANYLVIWCINLEMEGKTKLMEHVAHQCICMQFILELSKQLDIDPRGCVSSFFTKIQVAEAEYQKQFENEVTSFRERIRNRAKEKIQEALAEQEEEERVQRLGPGGLDPMEVFDSLPEELQQCFESRDIPLLQAAIAKLPEDEAKYHMKRCVESGLWVPEGGVKKSEEDEEDGENVVEGKTATDGATTTTENDDDEEIYHEALTTPQKTAPTCDDVD